MYVLAMVYRDSIIISKDLAAVSACKDTIKKIIIEGIPQCGTYKEILKEGVSPQGNNIRRLYKKVFFVTPLWRTPVLVVEVLNYHQ